MNVILEHHSSRKNKDIPLNCIIILELESSPDQISNADLVYKIQNTQLVFFSNLNSLKQLLKRSRDLNFQEIFFIEDKLEEFIISEEYIRVTDAINKEYNIDCSQMTKSEIIEKTGNKEIFNQIKGTLFSNNKSITNLTWLNYEGLSRFIEKVKDSKSG